MLENDYVSDEVSLYLHVYVICQYTFLNHLSLGAYLRDYDTITIRLDTHKVKATAHSQLSL